MLETIRQQLFEEQRKNKALASENARLTALIEYIAMMTDIELPQEAQDVRED